MKKLTFIITIMLVAALSFAAVACSKAGANTAGMPIDGNLKPDPGTDLNLPASTGRGYSFSFVRVDYVDGQNIGGYELIDTAKKFAELVLPMLPEADRGDAQTKYTDEFFKTHYIIRFFQDYSSGSIKPEVTAVAVENGELVITTEGKMEGDVGTCDMARHMGIVTLERSMFSIDLPVRINGAGTFNGGTTKEK